MAVTPTTVLVHGGGSTSRFWDRLLPHLDGPHQAVDLPGRRDRPADLATLTVDDEVASVVADVRRSAPDGPLVLVAHSSGGLVVPGVLAALDERVAHVVLDATSVPPEGGCGLDCMQDRHRWLVHVMRSGTARLAQGPASTPRHQATSSSRPWGSIVGSVIDTSMADEAHTSGAGRRTGSPAGRTPEPCPTRGCRRHRTEGGRRCRRTRAPPR